MLLQACREIPVSGLFDHLRERLRDLVLSVVDILQTMENMSFMVLMPFVNRPIKPSWLEAAAPRRRNAKRLTEHRVLKDRETSPWKRCQ